MTAINAFLKKRINGVVVYNANDFDYSYFDKIEVIKKPHGNQSGKKKSFLNVHTSFDIETSRIKEIDNSIMYVFMFGISDQCVILGRTWFEFKSMLLEIAKHIPENVLLRVWVHNLSYEFSFLKGIYKFESDDVFILDGRRVLKCTILDKIEFACSYLQSNMSLKLLTEKYDVKHKKLSGEDFDYSIVRYPWSKLSDDELSYCVNDVIGLNEAMEERAKADGDTIYTMPITSTGYVRRDCKRAMQKGFNRIILNPILPKFDDYLLLEESFRGGDTHANRYYAGQIIRDVVSYDRASSYPDVIMNCKFPMGEWFTFDTPSETWLRIFVDENYNALLVTATFYNLKLHDKLCGHPYIPKHKCRELEDCIIDNGRVLTAKKLTLVFTDIDFRIISDIYDFEIEVHEIRFSKYDFFPKPMREQTQKYFRAKTELKGVKGSELLYEKSKNLLNSIYGMCAQKLIKQNTLYDYDNEDQFVLQSDDIRELYDKANRKAWLSYAWSVWVTSHARYRLFEGQKIAKENFVYADTDSVKFIRDKKIEKQFAKYNDLRIADSEKNGAYAKDKNGKIHYMGTYDLDGEYKKFVTLGAKKYAYEDDNGLHITIAGVNKSKGAKELSENGGINAFRLGFVFRDAGGLEAVYNDKVCFEYAKGKHKILITDNVCLKPSTYTLGITDDYLRLISGSMSIWD